MREQWRRRLAEKARAKQLSSAGGTPESAPFHSRAYHRNFEGYTEVKALDARGRPVIRRVYTGKYYEPDLAPFRRVTLRIFYLLFFSGGTALFLFCATRTLPCNRVPYVSLFQAISVPLLIWCVYVLIFYVPSAGQLTVGEYKLLHHSLIRATRLTAACMWACAAAALVCFAAAPAGRVSGVLLCAGGFAVSGGLISLIALFERNLEYTVASGSAVSPEDGVEIE